ncbi:flagellar biosynthetic protein FliQ [Roseomonas sp. SSH11]|uniref:Flagellar biosynthetic protein FliQ n=1 Tax=Pararoseomonas baculiformis TaxID=2820812 RepID=A0ABS4AGT2_9PROT|nr:flagellar biosynthetic protein FliQ [Pararoseomonas baculiformis]MBP0446233.1 flagellar biosynthetic protein FliQ [Pararoseomonas baculiformis]
MENDIVAQSLRDSLWITLQLGAPLLVALLAVGLAVSVVQALTQVQEASLAFLPKLAVAGGGLMLLGPFMAGALRDWTITLFDRMVTLGGLP